MIVIRHDTKSKQLDAIARPKELPGIDKNARGFVGCQHGAAMVDRFADRIAGKVLRDAAFAKLARLNSNKWAR